MQYAIMAFIVFICIAGYKVYNYGDDSGYSRGTSECLETKNKELTLLNQENADLVNQLNLQRAAHRKKITGVESEYKGQLKENRAAHDLALDQYGHTLRVLLAEAENNREGKADRAEEGATTFISRLEGTEGSKLAPETTRDLELMSIDEDQKTLLLRLCVSIAKKDRE